MKTKDVVRLRELDFLRGIAIILVLMRHCNFNSYTHKMGWIGVDLFFVLSGFLVSGLLFREYQKYGDIKPGLFLIRRGFKIYPIYYITYILYLIPPLYKGTLDLKGVASDLVFVQNYVSGWGYLYAPSWSLAVEEHFYLIFALIMFPILKGKAAFMERKGRWISLFELSVFALLLVCFMLRLWSNEHQPDLGPRLITMTHLRMDSLFVGALLAYWYYFHKDRFKEIMTRYRIFFLLLIPILLSFTPFLEYTQSVFARTYGFSLLSIAFFLLISWFLTDELINRKLDRFLSSAVVNFISRIGVASYSIYILHSLVNYSIGLGMALTKIQLPALVIFLVTSAISITVGLFFTRHVEDLFLSVRNRYFPSRGIPFVK